MLRASGTGVPASPWPACCPQGCGCPQIAAWGWWRRAGPRDHGRGVAPLGGGCPVGEAAQPTRRAIRPVSAGRARVEGGASRVRSVSERAAVVAAPGTRSPGMSGLITRSGRVGQAWYRPAAGALRSDVPCGDDHDLEQDAGHEVRGKVRPSGASARSAGSGCPGWPWPPLRKGRSARSGNRSPALLDAWRQVACAPAPARARTARAPHRYQGFAGTRASASRQPLMRLVRRRRPGACPAAQVQHRTCRRIPGTRVGRLGSEP